MSIKGKLLGRLAKRLGAKKVATRLGKRSMSIAQKSALKKAVKASALARRKGRISLGARLAARKGKIVRAVNRSRIQGILKPRESKLSRVISNRRLTGKRKRDFIKKYTNPKDFKGGLTNGKMMTAKQQASNFKSIMKANIKNNNSAIRAQARAVGIVERAEAGGINLVSSIGWTVALTAAVNPTYTMSKLEEAKNAIKQKL